MDIFVHIIIMYVVVQKKAREKKFPIKKLFKNSVASKVLLEKP